MKVYVGQTRDRKLIVELQGYGWGEMTQPKELPPRRHPYVLDNAAFLAFKAQRPWDADAFVRAVERCAEARRPPDFVVAPDVVGGGYSSLEHSERWVPWVKGTLQVPVYLAVQEGMTLDGVAPRLGPFDGVFVGGADATWKLLSAYWWTRLAHAYGKQCHVGRISGRERVRLVKAYGVDSIDSCVPLWSKENREASKGLPTRRPTSSPRSRSSFCRGGRRCSRTQAGRRAP